MKNIIILFCCMSILKLNAQSKTRFNQVKLKKNIPVWNSKQITTCIDSVKPTKYIPRKIEKREVNKTSLPTDRLIITSNYGYRIHPILKKLKFHSGLDIKTHKSKIYAVLNGTVIKCAYDKNLGNYVKIKHRNIITIYGHLSKINVKKGQNIIGSQVIGVSGSTGRATGDHLHFAVKYNNEFIDPKYLINKLKQLN